MTSVKQGLYQEDLGQADSANANIDIVTGKYNDLNCADETTNQPSADRDSGMENDGGSAGPSKGKGEAFDNCSLTLRR